MRLLLHLYKFWWLYLLVAGALTGAGWYIHHSIYESGYAASEAKWQARFDAAERAKKEADEKARQKEESSRALSDQIERQHEQTVASLNLRAADAERRYASFLRQHSASASCGAVRKDGGASGNPDAASAIDQRDERAAKDFGRLARGCEADAAALTDLQRWITEQRAILNSPQG